MLEATARAEDRHFWFRGLRRNARSFLERASGKDGIALIVDCGSGTGRNLDWLGTIARAVGVELSWAGLEHARRARRPVARATVARLPFADAVWICGYEGGAPGLVRELRERHPLAVLIVTGRGTSEGWEEEVTSAGADCACPWPLAIDHLKRILHRQLARRLA